MRKVCLTDTIHSSLMKKVNMIKFNHSHNDLVMDCCHLKIWGNQFKLRK